ncbi:MAG: hypothetical protein ACNI3A_18870 [Desulfovibrio sp.]|uniref:hypothetical protein n=1 Tax=Desulfovibrio sp. 7SRBS1 TaxID=3378064 RepID=UPI003B41A149
MTRTGVARGGIVETSVPALAICSLLVFLSGCSAHVGVGAHYSPARHPQLAEESRVICREHGADSVVRFRADGTPYAVCIFADHECEAQAVEKGACTAETQQGEQP